MRFAIRPANGAARLALLRADLARVAWRDHAWVAALVAVVVFGGWLRLSGANWDQGTHLHPDERFIASVANVIHWPSSPVSYFDVAHSPLSPYNTPEGQSYSYGTLPMFATKAVADAVGRGDYDHLYLVGRWLSALLDCATIVLVFLVTRFLLSGLGARRARQGGLVAAALYALTVAAVQASHFFTTDVWLTFFGALTLYLALRSLTAGSSTKAMGLIALVGACLGFTVACKISGLFVGIPVAIALVGRALLVSPPPGVRRSALSLARDGLIVLVSAYVGFRLVSPYAFAHSNWLDVRLGADYRKALTTQRDILDGKAIFPPTLQWLLSPRVWDPFRNLVQWQLGLPLGVVAVAGAGLLAAEAARPAVTATRARRRIAWPERDRVVALASRLMVLGYVLGVFFYMATRFQHMGRYLLPIVPFLAVTAGYVLLVLLGRRRRLLAGVAAVVIAATGAYALAFHAVYTSTTTRLVANDWIERHIPPGSLLADENWDDTLPVGGLMAHYKLVIVPVFDPDDGTKLRKLYASLSTADYYTLSSQRAWRTLGRLPQRYPLMVRFYRDLFSGRLGFDLAASITSEPRLFGAHLNDVSAEEAFSVYDHPPVKIFRHRTRLTFAQFRHVLCSPPVPSACA